MKYFKHLLFSLFISCLFIFDFVNYDVYAQEIGFDILDDEVLVTDIPKLSINRDAASFNGNGNGNNKKKDIVDTPPTVEPIDENIEPINTDGYTDYQKDVINLLIYVCNALFTQENNFEEFSTTFNDDYDSFNEFLDANFLLNVDKLDEVISGIDGIGSLNDNAKSSLKELIQMNERMNNDINNSDMLSELSNEISSLNEHLVTLSTFLGYIYAFLIFVVVVLVFKGCWYLIDKYLLNVTLR